MPGAVSSFSGLDLLSSSVLVLDAGLTVRYLNSAAEHLLAVSRRLAVGERFDRLLDCPAALRDAFANAIRHGWGYTGQNIELRRGDDLALCLNCTVNPTTELAEPMLLLEIWPIDQQLKATHEERLLEQQIANRELIRNLAHEIKNPLGGIRGAAQLLERELNNPDLREYTQVIIQETDRLQDLMKRLLSPHRPMHPGPVNIHEILERVRSLLKAEYPQALEIVRDYDTSLPELVGDREQLIQAILNIARNAAQAIEGCEKAEKAERAESGRQMGQLIFRTRVARQLTLVKKRHRLGLDLQVIDNGPGIPDEIRGRMFYPLVSGREGGNGLGLTLAQGFIQQHQGTIECDSRPGQTCFTIRLPLVAA